MLRWRWRLLAGCLLAAFGGTLTLVGAALAFNLLSLRLWLADRLPALATVAWRAHAGMRHDQAQIIEGLVASVGLALLAGALGLVLAEIWGWRPRAGWSRRLLGVGRGLATMTIVALTVLALVMPVAAWRTPAGLTSWRRLTAAWRVEVCAHAGGTVGGLLRCPTLAAAAETERA
jgi:hypothetical protein